MPRGPASFTFPTNNTASRRPRHLRISARFLPPLSDCTAISDDLHGVPGTDRTHLPIRRVRVCRTVSLRYAAENWSTPEASWFSDVVVNTRRVHRGLCLRDPPSDSPANRCRWLRPSRTDDIVLAVTGCRRGRDHSRSPSPGRMIIRGTVGFVPRLAELPATLAGAPVSVSVAHQSAGWWR